MGAGGYIELKVYRPDHMIVCQVSKLSMYKREVACELIFMVHYFKRGGTGSRVEVHSGAWFNASIL